MALAEDFEMARCSDPAGDSGDLSEEGTPVATVKDPAKDVEDRSDERTCVSKVKDIAFLSDEGTLFFKVKEPAT